MKRLDLAGNASDKELWQDLDLMVSQNYRQRFVVFYRGINLGVIKLGRTGRRLGIRQVAIKMRQLFPTMQNYIISECLDMDNGSLHRLIGYSPTDSRKCIVCDKLLKIDRPDTYGLTTGICRVCRIKQIRVNKNYHKSFVCLNCHIIFSRTLWEIKHRVETSGKEPQFCSNKCHHGFRENHHIKGRHECVPS